MPDSRLKSSFSSAFLRQCVWNLHSAQWRFNTKSGGVRLDSNAVYFLYALPHFTNQHRRLRRHRGLFVAVDYFPDADFCVPGILRFNEFVPSTQSALFITVNSDNVSTDDLVKQMQPLLPPADRRSPFPTIGGPEPVAVAKGLFAGFQQGKIDRSSLGPDFCAFLTSEKLELAASVFAKFGEPRSVELVSTVERGGMVHSTLDFEFEKTGLLGDLYRTPDGIIQEFLMSAK